MASKVSLTRDGEELVFRIEGQKDSISINIGPGASVVKEQLRDVIRKIETAWEQELTESNRK